MYSPQARVVRVAPVSSDGCPAKDYAVPEKTAYASDEGFDLKAGLRRVAKKLKSMKHKDGDQNLLKVSACMLIQEARVQALTIGGKPGLGHNTT